jgi:hypothetical protein
MLTNIIDKRTKPYRWATVYAIAEATSHDNAVTDADQASAGPDDVPWAEMGNGSLADAIAWANGLPGQVTLFVYDAGVEIKTPAP